ncbi:MAG: ubiquinone biosynthesis protein, partial [Gammaproteobacteria bacterium]
LFSAAWLLPFLPDGLPSVAAGSAVLVLGFVFAIYCTGKITRPLSRLFVTHEARSNNSLVASFCEITSLSVNDKFGQAKVEDGGAGLIISVRADTPNNLKKGDRALIYEYDPEKNLYFISKHE